ncbi:acetyltransferase [Curtobacterium sp. 260]|uniref:acetyltransferase n=1 Tax=Curtobacterium sp. 260 TaxID=2817748 RepID=UPI00277DE570|nr:acetyltransferase [Curtobacterium sp. 260]MDP9738162.1 GNAT superfamily N-acetyltransferase [Curtobacterium sp. 260]
MGNVVVMRAEDARRRELESEGWVVIARSFGARLEAADVDQTVLQEQIGKISDPVQLTELDAGDANMILELDQATADDYPGSVATQHEQMTADEARPTDRRRAFGAVDKEGVLLAMTFVEVEVEGGVVDTDFTVVRAGFRRTGLGAAVKAYSILALLGEGALLFRTGGSADNAAIIGANARLGYVRDEEWVTLAEPDHPAA